MKCWWTVVGRGRRRFLAAESASLVWRWDRGGPPSVAMSTNPRFRFARSFPDSLLSTERRCSDETDQRPGRWAGRPSGHGGGVLSDGRSSDPPRPCCRLAAAKRAAPTQALAMSSTANREGSRPRAPVTSNELAAVRPPETAAQACPTSAGNAAGRAPEFTGRSWPTRGGRLRGFRPVVAGVRASASARLRPGPLVVVGQSGAERCPVAATSGDPHASGRDQQLALCFLRRNWPAVPGRLHGETETAPTVGAVG